MMRSMFSGVSGLRVHQTKMDVIANNISNVNTVGFKSSRVTFAEIFAQTVSGAARANETTGRGGTNPMQIGLGATVASIDLSVTQGAAQRTDNPFDLMIQGKGFFIVGDNSGTYFTRAGAFNLDEAGNLVNPSGMRVMGWPRSTDPDPVTGQYNIQRGVVQPIVIAGDMQYAPPQQTSNIMFENNLNAINYTEPVLSTISFYDSLGNRFTAEVTFSSPQPGTDRTTWTWTLGTEAFLDGDTNKAYGITSTSGTIDFGDNGIFINPNSPNPYQPPGINITLTNPNNLPDLPASNLTQGDTIYFNFSEITQFGEQYSNVQSYAVDGYPAGNLINVSIGSDGIVSGLYSNGQMQTLWQIVVANFRNPAGLEKFGDNLYIPTPNSGEFDGIGEQVQVSGGKMMGGVLEMSNVDLAQEFTEMITTQRGFQANSRVITVSDDMLAELVNLKR